MLKAFKVKVNNKEFKVEVEELKESQKCAEIKTKASKSTSAACTEACCEKKAEPVIPKVTKPVEEAKAVGNQEVIAPLPGVIVEILVKEGKKVKENEPVVILEAMKMENSLLAPISGVVEKIYVVEGQTVDGNYPLITIAG